MKVPCGGFDLDESVFNVDKNSKQVKLNSPISYDYMPEGYPSKGIEYVTMMEEQEVTFFDDGSIMMAVSPVALDIKQGDKLTVVWDGVSYDVIVKDGGAGPIFGNLALLYIGEAADYPFLYRSSSHGCSWFTTDTATSHTIKVMRQQETITPMSNDFMPKNLNVVFSRGSGGLIPTSCNVTYDELRGWVKNGVPVFAIFKIKQDDGSVLGCGNIVASRIDTDKLTFYYETGASKVGFVYNSDGTFSVVAES